MPATHWLVLPTYDERENIEAMVRAVVGVLQRTVPDRFHVLVVDDGSPDGTGDIADALAAELGVVSVLHREAKAGLGRAYLAGFAHALANGAEHVLQMDADFSHDPEDLPKLIAAAQAAPVVLGSRYVQGGRVENWGLTRRFISWGGSMYARTVLGVRVRDLTGGFKCLSRDVVAAVTAADMLAQGYAFQVEVTYRAIVDGFGVTEVPITFRDRTAGQSKMSPRIAAEAAWLVPQIAFRARRSTWISRGGLRRLLATATLRS